MKNKAYEVSKHQTEISVENYLKQKLASAGIKYQPEKPFVERFSIKKAEVEK